jgi:hypothetical protein
MLMLPKDVTASTRFLHYADGITNLKSEYNTSLHNSACHPILHSFVGVSLISSSCPSDKSNINA